MATGIPHTYRGVTVDEGGPPLELGLVVDEVGHVTPRDGIVTLHATLSCSAQASVEMFAGLEQRFGRFVIRGFGGTFVECDGETEVSLVVEGESGLFTGGRAPPFAFGPTGEAFAFVE